MFIINFLAPWLDKKRIVGVRPQHDSIDFQSIKPISEEVHTEHMISGFFETYLQLTDEEEGKLMKEVDNLPREEAKLLKNLPISYEEKGEKKGIKKVALKMLKKGLSKDLIAEVTHLDMEEIEKLKEALGCCSILELICFSLNPRQRSN